MLPRQPNLLFLFADDQRFDTLGAINNPAIKTPNLDRLAASGTVFTHAHIEGGTCGAVCMPSRAMLHTGRHLFGLAGEGQSIPQEHTLLGQLLWDSGYHTFGTGKWHNGTESFARSFNDGAEIFFGGMADHWNVPACDFDGSGKYDKQRPFVQNPQGSNRVLFQHLDHIHPGVHSTKLFAQAAIDFFDIVDPDHPFFAYVSFMAPHDPRTMPQKYYDLYDPAEIPLPPNFQPEHLFDTGALRIRDELLAGFPRDPQEIRRHIHEYYAMISHLDAAVGRILDGLEKTCERDNTLIVFSGDNGLAVGQHGLMGKQNLYDHSVRVPLIFAGPQVPADHHVTDLVYLQDVFPTLCDLMRLPTPESVQGQSFASALTGQSREENASPARDALYLAYADSIRGLTTGHHKLIEYAAGGTQLFDLQEDPWEQHNLAETAENADLLDSLRRRLMQMARDQETAAYEKSRTFWESRPDLPVELPS